MLSLTWSFHENNEESNTVLEDMMFDDRHDKSDETVMICVMMRHHKTELVHALLFKQLL